MPDTVWVLMISTKHGNDIAAYRTQAAAQRALLDYVDLWWIEEVGDIVRPDNPEEAIEQYFEAAREGYDLLRTDILE